MKKVSDLQFRVIDKNLFLPIARRLARDAAKVSYWTPVEKSFPTVKDFVGDGFPDITRVESPWEDFDEVDCWVFPDVGFSHLQAEIKAQGKSVWGAGNGDRLETSRMAFLQALEQTELPIGKHSKIRGITHLKEYLHDKKDIWIKISRFRGDFETMHWRSWEDDESTLDARGLKLGPFREKILFYAFDAIETQIEDGCDTWCIDGKYPSLVVHGVEAKDRAYMGTWQEYSDLPEELRKVSDAFAPILAKFNYRSFFSTEVRITEEGESYFIDPTCRAGSPPSQVMTEMIANYSQVIWGGANGELIEPESAAEFGVQALVCVCGDRHDWRSIKVDSELDRWLKCPNAVFLDDRLWFPPDPDAEGKDIGWLVGIGDKMGEAIRHLQHNAKLLPDGATCEYTALADLIKEIEAAEEAGMVFSDQPIPKPEIVVQDK